MKRLPAIWILAMTGLGPLALALPSQGASSANYSIAPATLDAGGARSASAKYTHDGSFGGFGGTTINVATRETNRVGYAGQLLEPVSLTVSVPSTNINEATSQQLSAGARLDNSSVTTTADWSVLNGPVAAISPAGLLTAANVYQDTPATIFAAAEGLGKSLGLMIRNVGINDLWQVQYFGIDNPNATGAQALFAYTAGLNPTNPADVFTFKLSSVSTQANWRSLSFAPRYTNRTYLVEYRTNLAAGGFTTLTSGKVTDAGLTRTVADTNAVSGERVYRVKISYP